MLSTEAVGLVIKAAKGVIKLTQQIDLVQAEKEAIEAPLALPVPPVAFAPTQPQMRRALRNLLQETQGEDPDPLDKDRADIQHAVDVDPNVTILFGFMQTYLPEQALGRVLDLDRDFMKALQKARPEWASDPGLITAAFYIGAGPAQRNKSYAWRLALIVVDSLAEFGADNMALFARDKGVQSVVGAVLRRFGNADVQNTDSTGALIRIALSATLNGVLDTKPDLDVNNPWLEALLDALVSVRTSLPEGDDDFVAGLLQGKGYPLLVSSVLNKTVGLLGDDDASILKDITATFLAEIAEVVKQKPSFEDFFKDQWSNLIRAGLSSIEKHGPVLLGGTSPLLREVLLSTVSNLARSPNNKLLSTDALVGIVDTAIAVVASNPDQIDRLIGPDWIGTFVSSISTTISNNGIRATFTPTVLEKLVKQTLGTFIEHPELVIDKPGLARDLLRSVLTSLSGVDSFSAEALDSAAIGNALTVMADHPEVLKFKYGGLVASLTGKVGMLVKDKQLTKVQGADLLKIIPQILAENPSLFLNIEKGLAGFAVDAAAEAAKVSNGLLSGITFVKTLQQVLQSLATTGNAALKNHPTAALATELENLLKAALERAEKELGNQMGISDLPEVIGQLVQAWAKGEIATINPENDNFRRLFSELIKLVRTK